MLGPLGEAFGFVGIDAGTHVRFADRAARLAAEIGEADLVDVVDGEGVLASVVREQASELPIELRVGYRDTLKDFGASAASSRRLVGASRQIADLSLPAALWDGLAGQAAERRLHARWAERTRASFALPPSRIALEPGDVVGLTTRAGRQALTLEEIEDGAHRRIEARSQAESVYRPAAAIGVGRAPSAVASFGPAEVVFLDLPRLVDGDDHRPYVAAYASPWPGAETVWRSATGAAYEPVASVVAPATLGRLVEPLESGAWGRWDAANTLLVDLAGGSLEGRSDLDVFAGANAMAVEATGGGWEVLQFAHAELVGERRYRLSRLLRGQLGTEDAMEAGHPAGARAVLLSKTATRLPLDRSAVGLERIYRVGPPQGGIAGSAVAQTAFAAFGRGIAPLSPVHARARRTEAGNVTLSWIRRTRIGGDDWSGEDVPLGETAERYRLEILNGGEAVRTVETGEPAYVYAAAEQIADFGGPPASLDVRIAQLASGYGAGIARAATFNF